MLILTVIGKRKIETQKEMQNINNIVIYNTVTNKIMQSLSVRTIYGTNFANCLECIVVVIFYVEGTNTGR